MIGNFQNFFVIFNIDPVVNYKNTDNRNLLNSLSQTVSPIKDGFHFQFFLQIYFIFFKNITTPVLASIIRSAINLKFGKYMMQLFCYLKLLQLAMTYRTIFKNRPSKICGK